MSTRAICITGPTATGKTSLALELAEWSGGEIVSMDSAMVYRYMDVGTDKPSAEIRARFPHHLVDVRDPESTYSAGAFARDATAAIGAINARGRLALVVGGTLLYLRALRDGLAELPVRDSAARAQIDLEALERGWPALHAELAAADPEAAARIQPTDRQRIQRALEVFRLTGQPLSQLQRDAADRGVPLRAVALLPEDRGALGEKIAARFDQMVDGGFVEEVERLRARSGLNRDTPSMRAVGYRQIWSFLDGETDWEATRNRAIVATRQLAKRQMTWLRGDARTDPVRGDSGQLLESLKREIDEAL